MEEKIKAIVESEGFVEKMFACQEPEEVQALFAAEGVDLSIEEVKAVGKQLNAILNEGEELTEDDLDAVAGGVAVTTIIAGVVTVVTAVAKNWRRIVNWFRRW